MKRGSNDDTGSGCSDGRLRRPVKPPLVRTGVILLYAVPLIILFIGLDSLRNPVSAGHFIQATTSVEVEGKLTHDQEYSHKVSSGWVPVSGSSQEVVYEDKTVAIGGRTTLEKDFKASGDSSGDFVSLATSKSLSFEPIKTQGKFVVAQLDFPDIDLSSGRWLKARDSLVERWLEAMSEMKAKAEAAAAASITKADAAANLAISRQPPISSSPPGIPVTGQTVSEKDQVNTQGAADVTGFSAPGTPPQIETSSSRATKKPSTP